MGAGHPGRLHPGVSLRVPLAVLLAAAVGVRLVQVPGSGVLSVFRVHRVDLRPDMFFLHSRSLAVLCGQYIRVGAIRVAHGQRDMCSDDNTLDVVRLLRSSDSVERSAAYALAYGSVSTVCGTLYRLSGGNARFRVQIIHRL